MKKTGWQILSEIREALGVINGKIAEVELQLAELEGFMEFDEADEPEPVAEPEPSVAPAAAVAPTPGPVVIPEPEPAPIVVSEPEPVIEAPIELDDVAVELPDPVIEEPAPVVEEPVPVVFPEPEPETVFVAEHEPAPVIPEPEMPKPKPAVIDVMAEKCAWKTDIPGSPVRNIISGISLNDRILFVNTLFKGDAQAFQATIALFNSYETLSQAEDFIRSNYPGWHLDSEVVYRFMMAVRRKLSR